MSYSIAYTCSVTLAAVPYNYDALHIGLVLLAYGLGESRVAVTVTMSDHLNPVTPGCVYPRLVIEKLEFFHFKVHGWQHLGRPLVG